MKWKQPITTGIFSLVGKEIGATLAGTFHLRRKEKKKRKKTPLEKAMASSSAISKHYHSSTADMLGHHTSITEFKIVFFFCLD